MFSTTKKFPNQNVLEHTDFFYQRIKIARKNFDKIVANLLPIFFHFIYLKSSQMQADFCYHFRCLNRRNQTLVQNIVQKVLYIYINYPDLNYPKK